jgi:hypothetical protein
MIEWPGKKVSRATIFVKLTFFLDHSKVEQKPRTCTAILAKDGGRRRRRRSTEDNWFSKGLIFVRIFSDDFLFTGFCENKVESQLGKPSI